MTERINNDAFASNLISSEERVLQKLHAINSMKISQMDDTDFVEHDDNISSGEELEYVKIKEINTLLLLLFSLKHLKIT